MSKSFPFLLPEMWPISLHRHNIMVNPLRSTALSSTLCFFGVNSQFGSYYLTPAYEQTSVWVEFHAVNHSVTKRGSLLPDFESAMLLEAPLPHLRTTEGKSWWQQALSQRRARPNMSDVLEYLGKPCVAPSNIKTHTPTNTLAHTLTHKRIALDL